MKKPLNELKGILKADKNAKSNYLLYCCSFVGRGGLVGWTVAKKPKPEKKAVLMIGDAYIRGLKYIISNQPDKAIAEFTRAVQVDSNTIEIYQDLGNLFRERRARLAGLFKSTRAYFCGPHSITSFGSLPL